MTAEEIFERFFWPLYPEDARADLVRARTVDANPANNPAVTAHLVDAAELFAKRFGLGFDDASVHRLSADVGPPQLEEWARSENEVFNVVVHGVAWLGECVVRTRGADGAAGWRVRRPLWESLVSLASRAGQADLALFQWWLKALAGAGTLADRYRTFVEVPTARADDLPVIAPPDRRLPRIAKGVRYDVLHKHLKAHLPELRDLGRDFPSPERLDEMRFRWLDFLLAGGGRMLVVYGLGEGGLHVFWVGAHGFEKATYIPCESFPEPVVRADGDKLVVIVSHDGKAAVHETLWWGP